MVKFTGKLNRSSYWKTLLLILVCLVFSSALFTFLSDIQNADVAGASSLSISLAIIFFVLLVISAVYFSVALIGAIIRRAHDTNNSMMWIILGLFIPFGFMLIGLVPSQK